MGRRTESSSLKIKELLNIDEGSGLTSAQVTYLVESGFSNKEDRLFYDYVKKEVSLRIRKAGPAMYQLIDTRLPDAFKVSKFPTFVDLQICLMDRYGLFPAK